METIFQDIRYGLRMLIKAPSFSIIATIALALGIGGNAAIFSVVNAVLLQPLPFPNPDTLVSVFETDATRGLDRGSYSYPNYMDLREQNHVFEHVASYRDNDFVLTGRGDAVRLHGTVATANLFRLLGVAPAIGRTFVDEEDKPGNQGRVVILSQQLFEKRFNSDASIVNHPVTLDGRAYTVVGVMPRTFEFPIQNDPVDLWTTIAADAEGESPTTAQRGAHFLRLVARLKAGVTLEQAQAEMNTIGSRLEQQYPDTNTHKGIRAVPALVALVGDIRPALLIMLGAVAFVLLIACANVANLLLARAMTRHKEMAIRSAMGASRFRVVRQLLTESVMLSLAGGALGLLLAVWWSDLLISLGKEDIPRAVQVKLDWRVLGFTLFVSVLTGVIFGLVPAIHSSKTQLTESLKEGRGSGEGARRNRVRGFLVASELAIAMVLLIGAGLLIQSLWRLEHTSSGLAPNNILTFNLTLPEVKYPTQKQSQFFSEAVKNLRALPGVESASAGLPLPLSGDRFSISFEIDGRPVAKKDHPSADFFAVQPGYFKTMGIPIVKGRDFDDHDQHESNQVIIVTERFARQFFPNEDPLGKRIKPGITTWDNEKAPMREIIGVVADIRSRGLDTAPKPAYYLSQNQAPFSSTTFVLKTSKDPHSLTTTVARTIQSMDSELPVFGVKTMDEYLASSVAAPRFNTTLLSVFAGVALVLTIVGLYGVMSYSVAQRTGEIGIRMALGAQTKDVMKMVFRQGLRMILIGLGIGLVIAFALMRIMASLLFGVTAKDPATFIIVASLLMLVALLACYLPARRATKVDPLIALKYE
jgi:putative ABC transport system permease protein